MSDHNLLQIKINFLPYRGKRNIKIKIPRVDREQLGKRSGNFETSSNRLKTGKRSRSIDKCSPCSGTFSVQ